MRPPSHWITPVRLVIVAGALCSYGACAGAFDRALIDLPQQLQRDRLGPDEHFRITRLVEDEDQSALLVQVRDTLPLHFHKRTREVIYLLDGQGILQLDAETIPIRTGAVVRIQPGQVHTFTNQGAAPAVFYVVTSPRFDETDRIMITTPR